jgi:hypothetical protein
VPASKNSYFMPEPADIGGKRLISLAPDAWVQWATQNPEVM